MRWIRMAGGAAVIAAAMLLSSEVLAGKPGGGGGGPVPPGTIHYDTYTTAFNFTYIDSWKMDGDGSNKQPSGGGLAGQGNATRVPSRQLHGGRWFLERKTILGGAYPDGRDRRELFATREDGVTTQLTNDPALQPNFSNVFLDRRDAAWAFDDSFVSFAAVSWTPVASGGNFTDTSGQEWLREAAIYTAALDWSGGTPVAGTPSAVVPAGVDVPGQADVRALDWSPSAAHVAYSRFQAGTTEYELFVTTFGGGSTVALGPGRDPEWSPDGSRIAFAKYNGSLATDLNVWTIKPDGTGLIQVTSTAQDDDFTPHWSPDGAYVAFTRQKQSNKGGIPTTWLYNVMRVPAGGGTPTDLTKDLSDNAHVTAWR